MFRHLFLLLALLWSTAAEGQWTTATDARVFAGLNVQQRKFTDFSSWESQNWFMLTADRPLGPGHLILTGMASLEPFTLKRIGSPQVFQTGELYQGRPLIDYQHPHDLIMGLGATYSVERHGAAYAVGADLVGPPALGPTAFMHRASARNNPQAPLSHHQLDSTHITPGVVRAGVTVAGVTVEASIFNGKEPDDRRVRPDVPRLDSWSGRLGWQRGSWRAQFSGARVRHPQPFEPYDITRLTASIEFIGTAASRPLAITLAWGENRELHGILDGYVAEWDWRVAASGSLYGRGELVAKDILNLGTPAPPGFTDFHRISHVDALTAGYVHDVARGRWGMLGVGGDATVYRVSANLEDPYGSPHSFHFFLRWHPNSPAPAHRH